MPDLLVKLYDLPPLEPVLARFRPGELVVRGARAYEKHQVISWVQQYFGAGWASECDVAFSHRPVSCFIAVDRGEMVGFACYESTCKNFFGPIGVAEAVRGSGLGTALLLSCLHAMAAQGYAYAIIGDADESDFYAKTVGAIVIPDSSPGIYRNRLRP